MSKKREYPKDGTTYYIVTVNINEWGESILAVTDYGWENGMYDQALLHSGNFFLTKREALAAKRKLQAAIKDVFKH